MESSSDSVNGVNANVPLGDTIYLDDSTDVNNDGGEKVVGALLVDDSGPVNERPQMGKTKSTIPIFYLKICFQHLILR